MGLLIFIKKGDTMEKECCPKLNVKLWDGKTFKWKNKHFIKETMPTLFHMPLPWLIGRKMKKLYDLAMAEKAGPAVKEWLFLFYDPTPFKSEIYMTVTKPVTKAQNVDISGTFEAKVFDGPYKDVPKFMGEMDSGLAKKGKKAKKYYIHYAYCPKCSKKYGHNYMIFFAGV